MLLTAEKGRSVQFLKNVFGRDDADSGSADITQHDISDMEEIGQWLSGAKAYCLQSYKESDGVISVKEGSADRFMTFSGEELAEMLKAVQKYIPEAALRYSAV